MARGGGQRGLAEGVAEPVAPRLLGHGHRAEQQVAVAADVLRERLHADVHAVGEGIEHHACGVGVVQRDRHPAGMGGGADRERLGRQQLLGVAMLVVGVSALSLATAI